MSEPNRVWEVICGCGYEGQFRHEDDAYAVYKIHSDNPDRRCRPVEFISTLAHPKGEVDPEDTLPYDVNTDPDNLSDPEMFHG